MDKVMFRRWRAADATMPTNLGRCALASFEGLRLSGCCRLCVLLRNGLQARESRTSCCSSDAWAPCGCPPASCHRDFHAVLRTYRARCSLARHPRGHSDAYVGAGDSVC
ncbi:hypothetical protein BD310DRAFT_916522 [Dichomitus squalens]|uniref:Uncharacterized protein n=1 Tax=Dichomitus squalens TaxID=114155 RepID=A0A4Q9Q7M1_9APHY|nr:hypothetical protein BD310DRAFT_916522 [Dichomitus squalens]